MQKKPISDEEFSRKFDEFENEMAEDFEIDLFPPLPRCPDPVYIPGIMIG